MENNFLARITKNVSFVAFAQIIARGCGTILLIIIARKLGVIEFGIFTFAFAFGEIAVIFTDLGLNALTIRDIAQDKKRIQHYFGNLLITKIILFGVILLLSIIFMKLSGYSEYKLTIVSLMLLALFFESCIVFFNSIFRAFEQMQYEAILYLLKYCILLPVGVYFLFENYGLLYICSAFVFSNFITLALGTMIIIKKYTKFNLYSFSLSKSLNLLKKAFYFGLFAVFFVLYFRIDTIILSHLKGDEIVGYYNASYRLTLFFMLIPTIVGSAFFPTISNLYVTSYNSCIKFINIYLIILLAIAVPIVTGGLFLSKEIILFLYGTNYSLAVNSFRILILSVLFIFAYTPVVGFLNASGKEKIPTGILITGTFLLIILDIFLIPKYNLLGACLSTVIVQFFMALFYYTSYFEVVRNIKMAQFIRILLSNIVMITTILLLNSFSIQIIIPAALTIYCTSLYLTKYFKNMIQDFTLISLQLEGEK